MLLNKGMVIEFLNSMPIINKDSEKLNRGWYICMGGGYATIYLDKDGMFTHGVRDFWDTKEDARDFLIEWEC